MSTNAHPPRCPDGGFTLVEVLVALMLLAVGLLGLQALGVSAVRMTAAAEHNSRAAVTAGHHLDEGLRELRQGQVPSQFCITDGNGDRVSRAVDVTTNSQLPRVVVKVFPRAAATSYAVGSYVYSPNAITTAPAGDACA